MTDGTFKRHLATCLRRAHVMRNGVLAFDQGRFFESWMDGPNQALYFLFRKNLRVTNIQFAELVLLLRSFSRYDDSAYTNLSPSGIAGTTRPADNDLQVWTADNFKQTIGDLMEAFLTDNTDHDDVCTRVADLYGRLIYRTVVLDCFHGSCCVFRPRHISIDIKAVCAYSGYVHSCGYNIFARNVQRAEKGLFFSKLDSHVSNIHGGRKIFFAVYSNEDFTAYDYEDRENLSHGLDEVKIDIEKFCMTGERLVSVIAELQDDKRFEKKLLIPAPGDYREKHAEARRRRDVDESRTIWLLTDRGIDHEEPRPSGDRYYICYDQLYINANQFYIFDENKPAWIAHTTLPHTLAAAMLNLSRPEWFNRAGVHFGDPFAGTGTTMIECLKESSPSLEAGDLSEAAGLLMSDNVYFFTAGPLEIKRCCEELRFLRRALKHSARPLDAARTEDELTTWKMFGDAEILAREAQLRSVGEAIDINTVLPKLKEISISGRLCFYIWLRAIIRRAAALQRGRERPYSAWRREARKVKNQLRELYALLTSERIADTRDPPGFVSVRGMYSNALMVDRDHLAAAYQQLGGSVCAPRPASEMPANSCNVVVADPPYGFNTEEDSGKLATTYATGMEAMVNAIKAEGHLLVCLLDRSFTGRQSHAFTRPKFVVHQILSYCRKANKEVINLGARFPQPSWLFHAPYYWESQRALRRVILHFHIRDAGEGHAAAEASRAGTEHQVWQAGTLQ